MFDSSAEISQDILPNNNVVNVASVPQRSPFRYPGGKTWLVPTIRHWLNSLDKKPTKFIEPFAGGGIISLTVAFEDLAKKVVMVELDEQVAAVWKTIFKGDVDWLIKEILDFDLNYESVEFIISQKTRKREHIAFQTILKNRIYHGGIMAHGSGMIKYGENGKGIASRWYPQTLARRIGEMKKIRDKLLFMKADGFEIIKKFINNENTAFYLDPPYTADGKKAGTRLYNYYEVDHDLLFSLCSKIKGRFLMTYDISDKVVALAKKHHFQVLPIAMKNTHHMKMTELLISKDLSWFS
jgi:DNA adenine methylase